MFAPGAGRYLAALAFGVVVLTTASVFVTLPLLLRGVVGALTIASAALLLFLAWFFRDPERAPGDGIVSAADGKVQSVSVEGDTLHIAVFMNVTDVHVNRFPVDAEVRAVEDAGSGFRPAYAADAHHNLQRRYTLATDLGEVTVVQMTGIVARRLVSLVRPPERHRKGDRLGMIVLGSRVDVRLPAARVTAVVAAGQRVVAGVTPIARERR